MMSCARSPAVHGTFVEKMKPQMHIDGCVGDASIELDDEVIRAD